MLINKPMNFHHDILNGCLVVTEHKRQECKVNYFPKGHNSKNMQRKLKFFVFSRPFMLINNAMKFHLEILNGSQVTKRT